MRLIDADRLKKKISDDAYRADSTKRYYNVMVEQQPTVEDAVVVVRCKDCVNYCGFEHCKNGICDLDSVSKRAVYPNDFCSYGERKSDNE